MSFFVILIFLLWKCFFRIKSCFIFGAFSVSWSSKNKIEIDIRLRKRTTEPVFLVFTAVGDEVGALAECFPHKLMSLEPFDEISNSYEIHQWSITKWLWVVSFHFWLNLALNAELYDQNECDITGFDTSDSFLWCLKRLHAVLSNMQ